MHFLKRYIEKCLRQRNWEDMAVCQTEPTHHKAHGQSSMQQEDQSHHCHCHLQKKKKEEKTSLILSDSYFIFY